MGGQGKVLSRRPWSFWDATWENLGIRFVHTFMEPKHTEMTETSSQPKGGRLGWGQTSHLGSRMSTRRDNLAWSPSDNPGGEQVTDGCNAANGPHVALHLPPSPSKMSQASWPRKGSGSAPRTGACGGAAGKTFSEEPWASFPREVVSAPLLESRSCWGVHSQPWGQVLVGMRELSPCLVCDCWVGSLAFFPE